MIVQIWLFIYSPTTGWSWKKRWWCCCRKTSEHPTDGSLWPHVPGNRNTRMTLQGTGGLRPIYGQLHHFPCQHVVARNRLTVAEANRASKHSTLWIIREWLKVVSCGKPNNKPPQNHNFYGWDFNHPPITVGFCFTIGPNWASHSPPKGGDFHVGKELIGSWATDVTRCHQTRLTGKSTN